MRRRLLVIACLLCIGCAGTVAADMPAAPRIAENCPTLASFASIGCRVSALLRAMQMAAELGTLDPVSPTIAMRGAVAIANAELTCDGSSRQHHRSSASLGRLGQLLDRLRGRLIAKSRRRQLAAAELDLYLAVILPLRADVRALRKQLVCPGHSEENVCGDGVPQAGFAGGPGGEECDDGNTKGGDGCSAQCRIEPTIEDFSGFASFAFDRESAFGFCPPTGGLFSATIANDAAGVTTLRWSILRDDTDCGEPPFQCSHVDRFARALTSVEVEHARAAFAAVQVIEKTPNGCGTIAIDPCLVNAFRWDDFIAHDSLCRAPLVPADEVNRIVTVLTGLAHCDGDCRDGGGAGGVAE